MVITQDFRTEKTLQHVVNASELSKIGRFELPWRAAGREGKTAAVCEVWKWVQISVTCFRGWLHVQLSDFEFAFHHIRVVILAYCLNIEKTASRSWAKLKAEVSTTQFHFAVNSCKPVFPSCHCLFVEPSPQNS